MRTASAKNCIDDRGGYRAVAEALNVPVTTVHSWYRVNRIPAWRRGDVDALPIVSRIDAAKRKAA